MMAVLWSLRPEQGLHQVEHLSRLVRGDRIVDRLRIAARANDTLLPELRQVLRQGGLANFNEAAELPNGALAVGQVAENRKATLVADRLEK